MKVSDYRDLIDRLSYWFASLRSAATPEEREREAGHVRAAASDLMRAECPRAKPADRDAAERLIDTTAAYLIRHGLNARRTAWNPGDPILTDDGLAYPE